MSTTLPPFKTVAEVLAWCEREQERRDGVLVTKALSDPRDAQIAALEARVAQLEARLRGPRR